MGKPTGFIEWPRESAAKKPVDQRLHDFREFSRPFAAPQAKQQAGRCMDCGVPFCHQGCPLGNVIPDFNEFVYQGRWREAFESLSSTNNFPELTGRLCPAPCESACVLAIDQDAVTIEQLEKEIIERAFAERWVTPKVPSQRTGKRVAVVGSGPAGLAAAAQLNQAGHLVTVYEKSDRLGGLLRYGIPDFKLDKSVIDRRLALLEAEGISFVTRAEVGVKPTWSEVRAAHEAVLIAIGAERARSLDLPNANARGVVQAMTFLEAQNRATALNQVSTLDARGKRVVILGGGDTGSDCLGTALRQGAKEVAQVELLPRPPHSRNDANPWPQWPLTFRTSSSQEEGGTRFFARRTTRLEVEQGQLVALHWVDVRLEGGTLVDVPGSEQRHEVDLLILAMGFASPVTAALERQLGLVLDVRGNVKVDEQFRTSVPGLFAAGDAHRGASLIVWAIAEGGEAARHIDAFLQQSPSLLPTRGRDCSFGGR